MFLILFCLVIPAIFAAPHPPTPVDPDIEAFKEHVKKEAEKLWVAMDYNNNNEFDRHDLETIIHDYDSNGDKNVSQSEFEFHFDMQEPTLAIVAKAYFLEFDDNADGVITTADLDGVHDRMDHINKDGKISHAEFVAYQTELLTLLYVLQVQAQQEAANQATTIAP